MTQDAQHTDTVITENITTYMKQINAIPRISTEREKELAILIHTGTEEERNRAREELIVSNLKLVVKIAHDFKRYGMTFADIVAEGNIGLMTAADKFDPSKGAKFSCYAAWWIKQNIRKALADKTRTVRIPGGSAQRVLKLEKFCATFEAQNDRQPTDEEIMDGLGITDKGLKGIRLADTTTYSLDEIVKTDGETTFGEMIPEETTEYSVKKEADADMLAQVRLLLPQLSDRDRWLMSYSFSINGTYLPEDVIRQETGLTSTEVAVRIKKCTQRLRELIEALA